MKRFKFLFLFFFLPSILVSSIAFAMDDDTDESDAGEKARKAHQIAGSDMIYQQEEWKALYYQNIQIIQLLKEIRDLVQIQNQRAAKAE